MKRITTLAVALLLSLGFALSAQAVTVTFEDGTTANNVLGGVQGASFVDSRSAIAQLLSDNASTTFDLHLLAKSSEFNDTIGTGTNKDTYKAYSYGGFDTNTGLYNGSGAVAQDVKLGDVTVSIQTTGMSYVFEIDKMTEYYAGRDREMFDTNTYTSVSWEQKTNIDPKFQLYLVTDDMVEINGNTFYKGSLIFALDDGGYAHTDFNDLVFVLAAQAPPAVPIPGAAFLLAPGLAGIVALRKKLA